MPFHFVGGIEAFCYIEAFNLLSSTVLFLLFFFLPLLLVSNQKDYCQDQCQGVYPLNILLGGFTVSEFTFNYFELTLVSGIR